MRRGRIWPPPLHHLAIALLRLNARRLGTLLALTGFIRYRLTIAERLESVAENVGVMNEQVLGSILRCDESIALIVAEPLDRAICQFLLLPQSPASTHILTAMGALGVDALRNRSTPTWSGDPRCPKSEYSRLCRPQPNMQSGFLLETRF